MGQCTPTRCPTSATAAAAAKGGERPDIPVEVFLRHGIAAILHNGSGLRDLEELAFGHLARAPHIDSVSDTPIKIDDATGWTRRSALTAAPTIARAWRFSDHIVGRLYSGATGTGRSSDKPLTTSDLEVLPRPLPHILSPGTPTKIL